MEELTTIFAIILFKGGNKDPQSHRSYQKISTCPVLAKALDYYIVDFYSQGWQDIQAKTQFQGKDSSHELASLAITEAALRSVNINGEPMYLLLLDVESAFDRVMIKQAIRCAFTAGTCDEGLLYLNKRLKSRLSFIECNRELLGPIVDTVGLEQGGVVSDQVYRLVNNEQLDVTQASGLGIDFGVGDEKCSMNIVLSAVGQADDVALMASSLVNLKALLYLTEAYCLKFNVKLVPSKSELFVYHPKRMFNEILLELLVNPVVSDGSVVAPSNSAMHVGVSPDGNGEHLSSRFSAHRRAIFGLLSTRLGRGHYLNPVVSLKIDQIYGPPILASGTSSLCLTKAEEKLLDQYYKVFLERVCRHHHTSPCFIYFVTGRLPFSGQLHLKMFSLFGQVCRHQEGHSILAKHGINVFSSPSPSSKSWFWKIRDLCLQYELPHPISWLNSCFSKAKIKNMCKSQVTQFWLNKLRFEVPLLPSLKYLKTEILGLSVCQPMFRLCSSSTWEVRKATIQSILLSGRYSSLESLSKHILISSRIP